MGNHVPFVAVKVTLILCIHVAARMIEDECIRQSQGREACRRWQAKDMIVVPVEHVQYSKRIKPGPGRQGAIFHIMSHNFCYATAVISDYLVTH